MDGALILIINIIYNWFTTCCVLLVNFFHLLRWFGRDLHCIGVFKLLTESIEKGFILLILSEISHSGIINIQTDWWILLDLNEIWISYYWPFHLLRWFGRDLHCIGVFKLLTEGIEKGFILLILSEISHSGIINIQTDWWILMDLNEIWIGYYWPLYVLDVKYGVHKLVYWEGAVPCSVSGNRNICSQRVRFYGRRYEIDVLWRYFKDKL